jgi:hypothetical protein
MDKLSPLKGGLKNKLCSFLILKGHTCTMENLLTSGSRVVLERLNTRLLDSRPFMERANLLSFS